MSGQSFRDAELEGWDRKAGGYDGSLGAVTLGAINPLLEAAKAGPGVHILDIACGTGALAAEAAKRGANIIGIDFAPSMIAEATRRHPGIDFRVGDAEAIPLPDASMDVVTCSFGMLHMERPERVLAEFVRVLRPAVGRVAITSWMPDGDFFALVGQAVQEHADTAVPMPPAPPIFRFGDEGESRSALLAGGFAEPAFRKLPLVWTGETPQAVLELLYRGAVRTPMLIEAQTPETRRAIEEAILRGSERYRQRDGRILLKSAALLTTARRR
jgi:ubiquinone/menaquinone biosynthesis C-methylase UbiE